MVTRRLDAEERRAISSGSVYVWEERGPNPEATGVSCPLLALPLPVGSHPTYTASSASNDGPMGRGWLSSMFPWCMWAEHLPFRWGPSRVRDVSSSNHVAFVDDGRDR